MQQVIYSSEEELSFYDYTESDSAQEKLHRSASENDLESRSQEYSMQIECSITNDWSGAIFTPPNQNSSSSEESESDETQPEPFEKNSEEELPKVAYVYEDQQAKSEWMNDYLTQSSVDLFLNCKKPNKNIPTENKSIEPVCSEDRRAGFAYSYNKKKETFHQTKIPEETKNEGRQDEAKSLRNLEEVKETPNGKGPEKNKCSQKKFSAEKLLIKAAKKIKAFWRKLKIVKNLKRKLKTRQLRKRARKATAQAPPQPEKEINIHLDKELHIETLKKCPYYWRKLRELSIEKKKAALKERAKARWG